MKKITFYLMMLTVSITFCPNTIFATEKDPITTTATAKEVSPEVKILLERLKEIKDMDKSALTSIEKKALRKEIRSIKANTMAGTNTATIIGKACLIIGLIALVILLL